MRLRPFTWLVLIVAFLAGAGYFWHLADRRAATNFAAGSATVTNSAPAARPPKAPARIALLSQPGTLNAPLAAAAISTNNSARFAHRLSNTSQSIGDLAHSDKAILLENALLDTEQSIALQIPEHLKAQGEPGAYVVQSRNPLDDDFRALLARAGASIVSYIPNNAYLVRASQATAQQLGSSALVQAVLPFDPYFKINSALLDLAIEQKPLPEGTGLNLLVFPETQAATVKELEKLGVEVASQERSPLGAVLKVRPPTQSLAAIAGLPGVEVVELSRTRTRANDLTRERMGVAPTSVSVSNYLGLTGNNILVNVNDTGIDASHPDLAGRVIGDTVGSTTDVDGHGTHVAGIIAGSGAQSLTVSNAQGSIMPPTNGQFRGMAPKAKLFSMVADLAFGPFGSDEYLQETAVRTNALISNNSWHYFADRAYDLAAASYDAAVRDAAPFQTGSQPLLYVFAAGNSGGGSENGTGGNPDTIFSPGTAKNVITVGATEQPRGITNEVIKCTMVDYGTNVVQVCVTNQPWMPSTDDQENVAYFSGRGNVGIGIEGEFGRFKPDVVAPGTFVVSTRSTVWDQGAYYNPTSDQFFAYTDLVLGTNGVFSNPVFVPDNAVQVTLTILPTFDSPTPFPDMLIYVKQSDFPTTNVYDFVRTNQVSMPPDGGANLSPRGVDWHYMIRNPSGQPVAFDLLTDIVVTNELGNYFEVLSNLNNQLGPFYRYESGTSMSSAAAAGTLALMEEFFLQHTGKTNSPALMKALLINGARSVGNLYNFGVNNGINFQGWGLVNLPNSVPGALTNGAAATTSMKYFDQSPAAALTTGQKHTYAVKVNEFAQGQPLRATLVWTDPPGNPVASTKLVNDLDLIVTNLDNGDVFFGNDILAGSDSTLPFDTNSAPKIDVINNVENVYLSPSLGSNYTVTVVGRRVNVNAVTAHPNDVAQDYALVISSGDGQVVDGLTVSPPAPVFTTTPHVTPIGNDFAPSAEDPAIGGILFNERVGASTPLLGTNRIALNTNSIFYPDPKYTGEITVGMTNQWHFYVISNGTSFTNAAFVTFLPPTLSVPRMGVDQFSLNDSTRTESDIDLYVSTNSALTNLDPEVLRTADKSVSRGGTELVLYTNAVPGNYYVGIKSESQEGAEYGFLGVISLLPFGQTDDQGNQTLRGRPSDAPIPDGTPDAPGKVTITGVSIPMKIRRVIATNVLSHELMGDLVGTLTDTANARRMGAFAVLNNHSPENAVFKQWNVYDDSDEGGIPLARHSDGPGSLQSFSGHKGGPVWQLNMVDNIFTHAGTNNAFGLFLEKQKDPEGGITVDIPGGRCLNEYIDIPPEATNMTIFAVITSPSGGPVTMEVCPLGASGTDCKTITINAGSGTNSLSIDKTSNPPLNAGTYVIRLCNLGLGPVQVYLIARVDLDLNGLVPTKYRSNGPEPIQDDAVTVSTIPVPEDQKIVNLEVGVRIDHPRVSDLVLHLISPSGTRILLDENRGALSADGMGHNLNTTNIIPVTSTGGPEPATNIIDTGVSSGTIRIDWNFWTKPDVMHVYYEGNLIYDTGMTGGIGSTNLNYSGASTFITIVMNENGNTNTTTQWDYTVRSAVADYIYTTFTENTNRTLTPIKFASTPFTNAHYIGTNVALTNMIYYMPEDSSGLDLYTGENAYGNWQLEVWDNRAGATNPAPTLLSWELSFLFATARAVPIVLTNDIARTNDVGPGQIQYFAVDVPIWASFATNWLISASGPVNLLFNQGAAPTGTNAGDVTLFGPTTANTSVLTTNGAPVPLIPGARYFLGVQNPGATTVTFALQVDFDVTPLTLGVPIASTLGSLPRYFSYDVTSNETAVMYSLTNLSGNVNLYASKGVPFPVPGNSQYSSSNPGTSDESIIVLTNSDTFALSPGHWYLGVYNATAGNVNYTIVVTDYTNALPKIIDLVNRVPYASTNLAAANTNDYYRYTVSGTAVRAQFETFGASGDVNLVARKGLPLPSSSSYDYLSANPGTNDELITIFNYSNPVRLTPGDWFLTAVNASGAPVTYTIMATEFATYGTNVIITNSFNSSNSFCITWTSLPGVHYYVQGKTDLNSTNWVVISPTITATSDTTTFCVALPSPYHFMRVQEGLSPGVGASGPAAVTIGSITRTPSGVQLQWTAPQTNIYQVQWTPTIPTATWNTFTGTVTSSNGTFYYLDNGSQSGGLGGAKFYRLRQIP